MSAVATRDGRVHLAVLQVWTPDLSDQNSRDRIRRKLARDVPWAMDDHDVDLEYWGLRNVARSASAEGEVYGLRLPTLSLPAAVAVPLAWLSHALTFVRRGEARVLIAPSPWSALGVLVARAVFRHRFHLVVRVMGRTSSRPGSGLTSRVRNLFLAAVEHFALRRADLVVPMGDFTSDLAVRAGVPPERTVVLQFPAVWEGRPNSSGARVRPAETPLLVCAARLVPEKSVDVLLRAFREVVAAVPGVTLAIAGDGPARAELEVLAIQLGIEPDVRFHGWLEPAEMAELFARSLVCVLPSRCEEGLGMVLVEAGQQGCALVGSDLGGIRDIIRPGRNGFLVPPSDPQALASVLIQLVRDPAMTRRFGAAAREDSNSYFSRRPEALAELERRIRSFVGSQ